MISHTMKSYVKTMISYFKLWYHRYQCSRCIQCQCPKQGWPASFRHSDSCRLPQRPNRIKCPSLSWQTLFFLSILKTIWSERGESFSLRQGVRFIIDANKGDAPVRQIINGKLQKHYCLPGLKSCDFHFGDCSNLVLSLRRGRRQ